LFHEKEKDFRCRRIPSKISYLHVLKFWQKINLHFYSFADCKQKRGLSGGEIEKEIEIIKTGVFVLSFSSELKTKNKKVKERKH